MWPDRLNPQLLPKNIKKMYTRKLESFLENTKFFSLCESIITSALRHMNEIDKSADVQTMPYYLSQLDDIRSTDWKELWPEIAEEIK